MKALQARTNSSEEPGPNTGLLEYVDDPKTIVLALPDGLVPASALSVKLRIPLEIFIAQDLRAPCPCPCTIGVLTESGVVHLDQRVVARQPWLHRELRSYIEREIQLRQRAIDAKKQSLRAGKPLPNLNGHNVLFVEGGTSSSAKLLALIRSVRDLGAERIVAVIAGNPSQAAQTVQTRVDEVLTLPTAWVPRNTRSRRAGELS